MLQVLSGVYTAPICVLILSPQVVALLPMFFYPFTRVLGPTPQSYSSSPQFHLPLSVCVLVLPIHSNSPLRVLVAPPTFYFAPPAFEPLCQRSSSPFCV